MGAFDKIKDKAKGLMGKHGDQVADGVDKATDVIDDKTGGKYTDKLEKVDEMAEKLADNDGEGDTDGEADTTPSE